MLDEVIEISTENVKGNELGKLTELEKDIERSENKKANTRRKKFQLKNAPNDDAPPDQAPHPTGFWQLYFKFRYFSGGAGGWVLG